MLSNILTNKSVWRILTLYSYGKGIGYRWGELKEITKLQNKSLKIALKLLYFYNLAKKENNIIKLNFGNDIVDEILSIIGKEKERLNFPDYNLYLALNIMLSKLQKMEEIEQIYLFGSHAKKTASVNSDIDIAIISKNINLDFTKEQIELEEQYNYKFEFHTWKFGSDKLSKEIKGQGVKLI